MGIHLVAIKRDSRTVIKKCQTATQDKSVIRAIINDIKKKSEHFQEIRFQFINRTENVLAHNIIEDSLRRERKCTWKESYRRWCKKGKETHLEGEALHHIHLGPEGRWSRLPN
ncbi:hypothetical protein PVK06_009209 [Gossypium arboreum]|uniref:RNase H type-1 domain-containing protein n=1 Tax=Gossypium arboreum TaxID=29729 RepID=A0ABR0QLW1_GOSAR|nr:hypothetical protein PVK06_009209 [Gossypium arboreum]